MGVPAFFAWLVRKYPEVLSDLPGTVDENGDPSPAAAEDWGCDNLYLDMNGIVHGVAQEGPVPHNVLRVKTHAS